jgi:hypothetical protein
VPEADLRPLCVPPLAIPRELLVWSLKSAEQVAYKQH